MRHISFALTTPQVRAKLKDVTRRRGWDNATPGQRLLAVEKGQGLKKGEKAVRICEIEVVKRTSERLESLLDNKIYSEEEVAEELRREGFPGMEPIEFVRMFCAANACHPSDWVNRIEFKYV